MSFAADTQALYAARPRDRRLRWTVVFLLGLSICSWVTHAPAVSDLFVARRLENLGRFLTTELRPYPLRNQAWDWSVFWQWFMDLAQTEGFRATGITLGIASLAIILAAILGYGLAPLGCRQMMGNALNRAEQVSWRRRAVYLFVRGIWVIWRAIPEYIWAFLLLALIGPVAWVAVLALAWHNAGILGRLGAESIDNLPRGALESLRQLGAGRRHVVLGAAFPMTFNRQLLYFFYRFESCVRDATVLGMLGVVSLGYWIEESRNKLYYDEMLVFLGFGVTLVVLSEVLSLIIRGRLGRAER